MIPFQNRFHGHSSLNYVYKNGQAEHGQSVTVKYIVNPHRDQSRIAVVIGKKTLKSAVRRNLIRRRLYEYARLKLPVLNKVYDIAIIVKSSDILNSTHSEMTGQLDQILKQARIIGSKKPNEKVPKNS